MALLIACWEAELPPFILYVSIPSASLSFQAQQIWITCSCLLLRNDNNAFAT
jgi:hypothetical protein